MTPAEIVTAARRKYNAENAGFYADSELYGLIYEAELQLIGEEYIVQDIDTSITTVSGTRTYSKPSLTVTIERIEWNGEVLRKVDGFHVDDDLSAENPDTTATGTPRYWFEFADLIYLRPKPDAAQTLKLFRTKAPAAVTTASQTLEIPVHFHRDITNYVASEMAAKDENFQMAKFWGDKWEQSKLRFKSWAKRKKRAGGMATVKSEEVYG